MLYPVSAHYKFIGILQPTLSNSVTDEYGVCDVNVIVVDDDSGVVVEPYLTLYGPIPLLGVGVIVYVVLFLVPEPLNAVVGLTNADAL